MSRIRDHNFGPPNLAEAARNQASKSEPCARRVWRGAKFEGKRGLQFEIAEVLELQE
jgi:hypothetical protein